MHENKFFKILCLLIVLSVLFSAFALPSYSADYVNLISRNMSSSSWASQPTNDFSLNIVYNANTQVNSISIPSTAVGTSAVRYTIFTGTDFYANHTYRLKFDYQGAYASCGLIVNLYVKKDVNNAHFINLGAVNTTVTSMTHFTSEVNLARDYNINSCIELRLEFGFVQGAQSSKVLQIGNLAFEDIDVVDDSRFWNSLWQRLQNLLNSISSGFSDVGTWFSDLGTNIGTWFSNLVTNISNWFSNLTSNLSTWFSNLTNNIRTFFINLGDDISEFFDKLRDYLLYFQHPVELDENGVPVDEYGEPIYENIFDIPDFFETLDDWIDDLEQAKSDVESGASAGIQAFENTIVPFTSILNRVPVLTVIITFALAIIVIKKVIG